MTEPVEVTLARLEERIKTLADEGRHVHVGVSDLKAQANRWKGAFWVMVAVGGIVGWLSHVFMGWMK